MNRYFWPLIVGALVATIGAYALANSPSSIVMQGYSLEPWYLWHLPVAAVIGMAVGSWYGRAAAASVLYRPRETMAEYEGRVIGFIRPGLFIAAGAVYAYGVVMTGLNQRVLLDPMSKLQTLVLQDLRFWVLGPAAAAFTAVSYAYVTSRGDWPGRHAFFGRRELQNG